MSSLLSNISIYFGTPLVTEYASIKNFSSVATLESIARNNLKMAGPDEILLVINQPQPQEKKAENEKNKPKEKGIFFKER